MCPLSNPLYLCIKLFIMHFLCIYAVRPCQVQDVISQHLFKLSTQFFQYNKTHDLFSDQHLCQVAPKLQSRSQMSRLHNDQLLRYACSKNKRRKIGFSNTFFRDRIYNYNNGLYNWKRKI